MPGSFTVRPIEANLTHNTDLLGRMNPYCSFIVGNTKIKSGICKKGGKHPHWNDVVTLPATGESKVLVDLMDKDKITHDDVIGSFMIDLNEVQSVGQVQRWYPLTYKNKAAGEILLEAVYQPGEHMHTDIAQQRIMEEEIITGTRPTMMEEEVIATTNVTEPAHVWTEQRQIVEPHTFVKEVEVIEPKLVTKTIQVVENVPVKRQVEVVEMVNTIQEVETMEPQTFTKPVEVTEYVPVKQQVEVTNPVTVKKAVEFVEPVITTQTITKEVHEPVIVDQKITTEVGPASVIGMTKEYGFGEISLAERQRLFGLKRWTGYETIFGGLTEQERLWEMMRLSRLSDDEWMTERERLMGFKEQERLAEQRRFFGKHHHHIAH